MRLTIDLLQEIVSGGREYKLSTEQRDRVREAFEFLNEFNKDKVIYGINTGFGPMAQYKISEEHLNELQYNLVRSHATGTGRTLSEREVRAVLTCRLHTLALGHSGVSPEAASKMEEFLDARIYPEIFEHGGVGASGDLVQLAHLALGLIGEGYAYHKGRRYATKVILKEKGIEPLKLRLRDGLALMNGTSCMSGLAVLNLASAERLTSWATACSAWLNELISSYDDSFSEELNRAKEHPGQQQVAAMMREHLMDSGMIRKREDVLFKDSEEARQSVFKEKVQEYYSLRCVPQIIGPVVDTMTGVKEVVEREINSANDNPIVDMEKRQVFHGGNFHGDYVALEMDRLRIALVKLTMLMERQINYLMNAKMNEKFPPFLNGQVLGLNFGLQGLQFTATSTTAENQTLASPMYTHSISCNNDNQDVVSMGTNAAVLTGQVLENANQVLAIYLIGLSQATDILECAPRLSSNSQEMHQLIRSLCPFVKSDRPLFEEVARINKFVKNSGVSKVLT